MKEKLDRSFLVHPRSPAVQQHQREPLHFSAPTSPGTRPRTVPRCCAAHPASQRAFSPQEISAREKKKKIIIKAANKDADYFMSGSEVLPTPMHVTKLGFSSPVQFTAFSYPEACLLNSQVLKKGTKPFYLFSRPTAGLPVPQPSSPFLAGARPALHKARQQEDQETK